MLDSRWVAAVWHRALSQFWYKGRILHPKDYRKIKSSVSSFLMEAALPGTKRIFQAQPVTTSELGEELWFSVPSSRIVFSCLKEGTMPSFFSLVLGWSEYWMNSLWKFWVRAKRSQWKLSAFLMNAPLSATSAHHSYYPGWTMEWILPLCLCPSAHTAPSEVSCVTKTMRRNASKSGSQESTEWKMLSIPSFSANISLHSTFM